MKALIVFFSLEGNTKFVAEKIAQELSADMLELKPVKKYPTGLVTKYLWGGKSAVMGDTPKLEENEINLSLYDTVILGTPVWASTFAPPLRTFLQQNSLEGKNVAAFACSGGENAGKTFSEFQKLFPENKLIITVRFTDPLKGREPNLQAKLQDLVNAVQQA